MKYVAVEYHNGKNNTDVKGFLTIPDEFSYNWEFGFRKYIKDTYSVKGEILIYPLNIQLMITEKMGNTPPGYSSVREDFEKAIKSNIYYPFNNDDCNYIRRQWAKMDLTSPGYRYV